MVSFDENIIEVQGEDGSTKTFLHLDTVEHVNGNFYAVLFEIYDLNNIIFDFEDDQVVIMRIENTEDGMDLVREEDDTVIEDVYQNFREFFDIDMSDQFDSE